MANKDIQKEIRSLDDTAQFTLSTRQMAEYCQRIVAYLETEKRYREPGYSLWELSRDTGISTKIISKSINGYMGRNFYDLINRMRIEEAKKMAERMNKTADADLITANFHLGNIKESLHNLSECIRKIRAQDPQKAKNVAVAVKKILNIAVSKMEDE